MNEISIFNPVQPSGRRVRTNWPSCIVWTFTVPSCDPDTTTSNSVKIETQVTASSCPYKVFNGFGINPEWFWLGPVPLAPLVPIPPEPEFSWPLDVEKLPTYDMLFIDQTMHVQSFEPVTRNEPQLSSARHVITSEWRMTVATILPRFTLKTRKELSQMPPAYKSLPSRLTENSWEVKVMPGWNGPINRLRFLEKSREIY